MDVVPAPERNPHRGRPAGLAAACRVARSRTDAVVDVVNSESGQLRAALVDTLASAPPRRREVLALAAMGGLAAGEIALVLGLPVEAVTVQLHEGLNEVVSRLSRS